MLLGTIIEEAVIGILMESTPPPDDSGMAVVQVGVGEWVKFSELNSERDNTETQTDAKYSASNQENHRGGLQKMDVESGRFQNQNVSSIKELEAWLCTLVPRC
jgi:hypothetical protein